jgi:DNA-binding phage protein
MRAGSGENFWEQRSMARRSKDWNKGLAQDLRDPEFAREFLLAAVDEGVSLQHALGKAVRAWGIKEFALRIGMASPNLLRAINPRHNPTQATINRLLKPWGLRLSLAAIDRRGRSHAA